MKHVGNVALKRSALYVRAREKIGVGVMSGGCLSHTPPVKLRMVDKWLAGETRNTNLIGL